MRHFTYGLHAYWYLPANWIGSCYLANLINQIFDKTAFFSHLHFPIISDLSFLGTRQPKQSSKMCYSYKLRGRIPALEGGYDLPSSPGSREALEQETRRLGVNLKDLAAGVPATPAPGDNQDCGRS